MSGTSLKQVFAASSWLQLVNLNAAISSGILDDTLPEGVDAPAERVLLVTDNRIVAEIGPSFAELPEAAPLLEVFDRVIDYNDWIHPLHPAQWEPSTNEQPLWTKSLLSSWNLHDSQIQLFVESVQSNPARGLVKLFNGSEVYVHSDGLMSYGPTRANLPPGLWQSLRGFVYMDLIPGLEPLLLSEFDNVRLLPVDAVALADQVDRVCRHLGAEPAAETQDTAIIIGQYLSELELFTLEEEIDVYTSMLEAAAAAGHSKVYFKPHPAASASVNSVLEHRAADKGIDFGIYSAKMPLEASLAVMKPRTVYSCFSTGMVTARRLLDVEAVAMGTELALERFAPYENSNRIPVTICDYLYASPTRPSYSLQELCHAVGYCMQSARYPQLRQQAAAFLSTHYRQARRYFKRRRLTKLDLPGRLPPKSTHPAKRVYRAARHRLGSRFRQLVAARLRD